MSLDWFDRGAISALDKLGRTTGWGEVYITWWCYMLLYNKVCRTRKWSWLKKDNSVIVFFLPPLNSSRLPSDYAYFSLISNDHLPFQYWLLPRSKWSTTWGSLASTYGVSSPCFAGHLQKNDIRDAGSTADFADFFWFCCSSLILDLLDLAKVCSEKISLLELHCYNV